MDKKIEKIITKHTVNVNSFIDNEGKNHLPMIIKELNILFNNKLWEIGADIMKEAGVKNIKTKYKEDK